MTDTIHPEAMRMVGIPYVRHGKRFDLYGGTDCFQVCVEFCRRIGLSPKIGQWKRIAADEPIELGDAYLTNDRFGCYVYAGGGKYLTADATVGVLLVANVEDGCRRFRCKGAA